MQKTNYFKKTFIFVFVFFTVYKIVFQLFEGIETFTSEFLIKTLAVVFMTSLTLAVLNHFLKIDFNKKK
ncbi:hypothetical protein [Flavobacterium solisilvae]|uniref:Uncharacterized protein n=1 Tax=Flavobacterium solisilvae TaxID=1852019 RepID=A0ABX1QSH4_9FLAO|nr:hypothetical protein [Flavobacterium solisilvae]NMH25234.1 hypothetical protein [Flavobacterium solisilvae]